jgi:hypothetical protein
MTGYGENNVVMPNTVDVLVSTLGYLRLGVDRLYEGETRSRSCVERMARKRGKCVFGIVVLFRH